MHRPREEMVFHFPHYQGDTPHSAILLGDLKLMHFYEDDRDELFDLSKDIGERRNLASEQNEKVKQLRDKLQAYLSAVSAQLPTPNDDYDPKRPPEPKKRGGKNNPKKAAKR